MSKFDKIVKIWQNCQNLTILSWEGIKFLCKTALENAISGDLRGLVFQKCSSYATRQPMVTLRLDTETMIAPPPPPQTQTLDPPLMMVVLKISVQWCTVIQLSCRHWLSSGQIHEQFWLSGKSVSILGSQMGDMSIPIRSAMKFQYTCLNADQLTLVDQLLCNKVSFYSVCTWPAIRLFVVVLIASSNSNQNNERGRIMIWRSVVTRSKYSTFTGRWHLLSWYKLDTNLDRKEHIPSTMD